MIPKLGSIERLAHRMNWDLLPKGPCSLLLAVSGGADSVFLARALAIKAARRSWDLLLGHVHHGIRGAEADEDEASVLRLGEELGLEVMCARLDPDSLDFVVLGDRGETGDNGNRGGAGDNGNDGNDEKNGKQEGQRSSANRASPISPISPILPIPPAAAAPSHPRPPFGVGRGGDFPRRPPAPWRGGACWRRWPGRTIARRSWRLTTRMTPPRLSCSRRCGARDSKGLDRFRNAASGRASKFCAPCWI